MIDSDHITKMTAEERLIRATDNTEWLVGRLTEIGQQLDKIEHAVTKLVEEGSK